MQGGVAAVVARAVYIDVLVGLDVHKVMVYAIGIASEIGGEKAPFSSLSCEPYELCP